MSNVYEIILKTGSQEKKPDVWAESGLNDDTKNLINSGGDVFSWAKGQASSVMQNVGAAGAAGAAVMFAGAMAKTAITETFQRMYDGVEILGGSNEWESRLNWGTTQVNRVKSVVSSMFTWGATGAAAGFTMGGPIGAAVGLGVGLIAGIGKGIYDLSEKDKTAENKYNLYATSENNQLQAIRDRSGTWYNGSRRGA